MSCGVLEHGRLLPLGGTSAEGTLHGTTAYRGKSSRGEQAVMLVAQATDSSIARAQLGRQNIFNPPGDGLCLYHALRFLDYARASKVGGCSGFSSTVCDGLSLLSQITGAMQSIVSDDRLLILRVVLERLLGECGEQVTTLAQYANQLRGSVTEAVRVTGDGGVGSRVSVSLHGGLPEILAYMELRRVQVVTVLCVAARQVWVLQREPALYTIHEIHSLPFLLREDQRLVDGPVLQLMLNYGGDMSGASSHWQVVVR